MSVRVPFPLALITSAVLTHCAPAVHHAATTPSREPATPALPLAGRIWDVAHRQFIDEDSLVHEASSARFVLLGEVHDSADAHAHQASLVHALVEHGRHPSVVFEMIDADRQPLVDHARATAAHDPDAIATALDFAHSGWDWASYRPIVAAALEAGLPIVAGNLPHAESRALAMHGLEAIEPARAEQLGLTHAIPAAVQESMRVELRESHCGMLPESMLDGMALAQRGRDAEMAARMMAATGDGAVLIAGAGHARTDRGVPLQLHAHDANATVWSIGFVEVVADRTNPAQYAERFGVESIPFDVVWFVPTVEHQEDMCASLRNHAR